MIEKWIRTDEPRDVLGSIRAFLRTAPFVEKDPQAFKWLVLSLHSALQGACVCHLTTTAPPLGAVKPPNARDWVQYLEDSRDNADVTPPKTYVMELPDLLRAIRRPSSAGDRRNDTGVVISDSEFSSLKRFHCDIRNQFVHFAPLSWSIEVSGIPETVRLIARIIGEVHQVGWAFRHLETAEKEELSESLKTLAAFSWSELAL